MFLDIIVFAVFAAFYKSKDDTAPVAATETKIEARTEVVKPAFEMTQQPNNGTVFAGSLSNSGQKKADQI